MRSHNDVYIFVIAMEKVSYLNRPTGLWILKMCLAKLLQ